jgi:23S rRNA pseudouridine1911/1915/1917 synthase
VELILPIRILYADERIIAADKPAGMPVIPAPDGPPRVCLRHQLEQQLQAPLRVVHRIDRDTSGVVLFARDVATHRHLTDLFAAHQVSKTYMALTAGVPAPETGLITTPLHPARRGRMRPATAEEDGLPSETAYVALRAWERGTRRFALLEARSRTDRHHQIRVHLRSMGTPVLFDTIYGRAAMQGDAQEGPCQRLALHASRVEVPAGGAWPAFVAESPMAADLAALVDWFARG